MNELSSAQELQVTYHVTNLIIDHFDEIFDVKKKKIRLSLKKINSENG
jgi:hypothetical protein